MHLSLIVHRAVKYRPQEEQAGVLRPFAGNDIAMSCRCTVTLWRLKGDFLGRSMQRRTTNQQVAHNRPTGLLNEQRQRPARGDSRILCVPAPLMLPSKSGGTPMTFCMAGRILLI